MWYELRIRVAAEAVEAVGDKLRQLRSRGVVIEGRKGHRLVRGYFFGETLADWAAEEMRTFLLGLPAWGLSAGPGQVQCSPVNERDWKEAWKAHFQPRRVGRRFVIAPRWAKVNIQPEEVLIVLDPGLAFGTGEHETTRLCLTLLEDTLQGGELVADVGTGSGILAIAAAKMGARRVEATDVDPVAVEIARENAARNGVGKVVRVREEAFLGGLTGIEVLVANLNTALVKQLLPRVQAAVVPGGRVILSGFAAVNELEIVKALRGAGIRLDEVRHEGEWCALRGTVKIAFPCPDCPDRPHPAGGGKKGGLRLSSLT